MTELEVAQQQLAETRAAISRILTKGQEIGETGSAVRFADLRELRATETALEAKVSRLSRGGGRAWRITSGR